MDNLNKIPPKLSKTGKRTPFKVPENYFENFSVKLGERLHEKNSPEFITRLIPVLKPYFAIAIIAIVILLTARIFIFQPGKRDINSLKSYEITANIEDNIFYYSEETIIEAVYPDFESSSPDEDLTNEEIIEYLINDDVSIDEILNAI